MPFEQLGDVALDVVAEARARAVFERAIAVAPDPDGEHIWVLLQPAEREDD